jgi:uncharacterized protein (TIGR03437 family)
MNTEVRFEMPPEAVPDSDGNISLALQMDTPDGGTCLGGGSPFKVKLLPAVPALYRDLTSDLAATFDATTYQQVGGATEARLPSGGYFAVFGSGFGIQPLSDQKPEVWVNGLLLDLYFSGKEPNFIGWDEIIARVPPLSTGTYDGEIRLSGNPIGKFQLPVQQQ